MPLLRHFNSPRLLYVSDVIEFVRQTLVVSYSINAALIFSQLCNVV